MAAKEIILPYSTETYLPIKACQKIFICLGDEWRTRTVSGRAVVEATVGNSARRLGSKFNIFKNWVNPRCNEVYQYSLSVDLTQFKQNPATGDCWEPTCNDVQEVNPYMCSFKDSVTPATQ